MLSPQALMRGIVKRLASNIAANADNSNNDVGVRMFPYGEICVQSMVRKNHNLADEGTYFVANNLQTGVVPASYGNSINPLNPLIMIYNGNTAPSQGQNVYLDYISLTATVATVTTSTSPTACGVVLDNTNRYTSGGTVLTPQNPNMGLVANASGCAVYAGTIVSPAASGAARTIVGQRTIRPGISAAVGNVIGDQWMLNFGGVEQGASGQISITAGVVNIIPIPLPPVIIAPGQSALFYQWWPAGGATSAGAWIPEIGFFVR